MAVCHQGLSPGASFENASVMCEDIQQLLDHAEVLVIGNASREAALALAAIGPDHILVDLTRGVVRPLSAPGPASAVPSAPTG